MLPLEDKYKYRNNYSKALDIIKQNGEKSGLQKQRRRRHKLGQTTENCKPEILIAEAVLVIILLLFLTEILFLVIAAYLLCKYFTFIFESQRNNIDKLKKFGGLQEKTGQHRGGGKRVTCQKFMAKKPIDLNFYDKQEFLNAWDYTVKNKMRKNYSFYPHVPVLNKYELQDKTKKESENVDESEGNNGKDLSSGTRECQSSESKGKNFGNEKNCQDESKRGIGDDNHDHSGKDDDDNDGDHSNDDDFGDQDDHCGDDDHSQDDDYGDQDDHGGDDYSHGDHDDHGNEDNHDDDDDNNGNDDHGDQDDHHGDDDDQNDQDNCDDDDDDHDDQDDQGNHDNGGDEDDHDDDDDDHSDHDSHNEDDNTEEDDDDDDYCHEDHFGGDGDHSHQDALADQDNHDDEDDYGDEDDCCSDADTHFDQDNHDEDDNTEEVHDDDDCSDDDDHCDQADQVNQDKHADQDNHSDEDDGEDDHGEEDDDGSDENDSDGEDDSDDGDEDVDNQYKILVPFDEEKLGISYNSDKPCYNKNSEYVSLKLVGQGSFGKCYKIKDLKKKKIYAMKVITRTKDGSEELSVMKDLMDSPNILDIYGAVEDQKLICIFMPLAQGGTLLSFLQDFQQRTGRKGLDRNLQRHFLQGIMSGLKFMHSKGYIHRDIKSENILMFCEHGGGEWRAVISDFGFAIHVSHQSLKGALYGTAQFASPEAVKCEQLSYATDIWSSGCVLIEMDSGDPPWKYQAKFGLGAILYAIGIASEPPIPDDCTNDMARLYQGMLAIDPKERFTASEVLNILDEIH